MSRRTDKLTNELIQRYRLLKAVHVCYYNRLDVDVFFLGREFFSVTGDIMEGKPINYAQLQYLDEKQVEAYLKEDR
ncbi:hypothetical protein KJ782_07305 [Patescibacteria group bacterium]|nr:hypothetical protein [Patescibacteria group bacterium]